MKLYQQYLKTVGLFLVSFLLLIFSSCKSTVSTETDLGNSHILLVNGAASPSAITMYWTGNKLNTVPLVYGNTTGYCSLTSGTRDVQIKAGSTNTILATKTIHLIRDSSYTFFAYEANNTTTTVITEDDLSIPSFGNAKVRFVNMSPGLSSADLIISNGPPLALSVSFGTIGSYNELKANTYNFALRLHGSSTILLNIPNVKLDNGKIYTIWSGGSLIGTTTSILSEQTIVQ